MTDGKGRRHALVAGMRWLSSIGLSFVLPFALIDVYIRLTNDTLMSSSRENVFWGSIGIGSLPLFNLPTPTAYKVAFAVVYLGGMTTLCLFLILLLSPS